MERPHASLLPPSEPKANPAQEREGPGKASDYRGAGGAPEGWPALSHAGFAVLPQAAPGEEELERTERQLQPEEEEAPGLGSEGKKGLNEQGRAAERLRGNRHGVGSPTEGKVVRHATHPTKESSKAQPTPRTLLNK